MKIIGLIGGMSWESSLEYYRIINESVKKKLGNLHSAECILYSVDFEPIDKLQHEGKWDELALKMQGYGKSLQKAGAQMILICTNTMHKLAPAVADAVSIPLYHITDATADKIKELHLQKVGLLGTKFTMEQDFYKKRLLDKHGIEAIIPEQNEREYVHKVIYEELVQGKIKPESRNEFLKIIDQLSQNGAEGIILGCTEIPLLVNQKDTEIPILDTTQIHAEYAVKRALE